ncbi:hypothetical protein ABZ281_28130 [Streptomyces sp. NPDC006265]|uniref:hypothetical protein n=1 Tax=Streptomyces sp. NPDC006265 TaxID=3156740 RepID=UPI0033BE0173
MSLNVTPLNDVALPEPAGHEVVEDRVDRGPVLRVTPSFNLDGLTLSAFIYEKYAFHLDNEEALPESLTVDDVMRIITERQAICAQGWHEHVNEPSHESHEAAEKFAEHWARRLFPNITWRVETLDMFR